MELEAFFPGVWDKLTDAQRRALESAASPRRLEAGEQLSGAGECVGLLAVRSGRLRAYMISDTGREITLYRLFERDICLFFRLLRDEGPAIRRLNRGRAALGGAGRLPGGL